MPCPGPNLPVFFGLVCLTMAGQAAGRWAWSPAVEITQTYTDNVTLVSAASSESEWISELAPSLSLTGHGKVMDFAAFYRLQGLYFARDQARNEVYQQVRGDLRTSPRHLGPYINASLALEQQSVSSDRPVSFDNLNAAGNRTDRLSFDLSPGLRGHIAPDIVGDLSVGHRRTEYGKGRFDSDEERVGLVVRPVRKRRLDWSIDGRQTRIRYANGISSMNGTLALDMSYLLRRSLSAHGRLGYEDIHSSQPGDLSQASDNWLLGLTWTPSRRARLRASLGERFFGKSYDLSWRWRTRRQLMNVAYRESVETVSNVPGTASPLAAAVNDVVDFTTDLFLSRRTTMSWQRSSRRLSAGVSAYVERRTFFRRSGSERVFAAEFHSSWRWRPRTRFHLDWNQTQRIPLAGGARDTLRQGDLWLEYRLPPRGRMIVKYRNLHRDGRPGAPGYEANSLGVSLEWLWGDVRATPG